MLWITIGILVSYLVGAIPTAYLFCRTLKGIDIRTVGSGNVGATNASRILGKKLGIAVLLLDIAKGALVVTLLGNLIFSIAATTPDDALNLRLIFGVSAICGHNWPIFLSFKGGKGVASAIGVLIGLAISAETMRMILGFVVLTWLIVFIFTHIVSIASVAAALSMPVYTLLFNRPSIVVFWTLILSAIIVLRHSSNLKRLREGTEKKIF